MAGLVASPIPATLALPLVLRLGVGNRLPLHVARFISTMAIGTMWSITLPLQGPLGDPVAGVLLFELNLGALAALGIGRGASQH